MSACLPGFALRVPPSSDDERQVELPNDFHLRKVGLADEPREGLLRLLRIVRDACSFEIFGIVVTSNVLNAGYT
jgi:hypothetical protein